MSTIWYTHRMRRYWKITGPGQLYVVEAGNEDIYRYGALSEYRPEWCWKSRSGCYHDAIVVTEGVGPRRRVIGVFRFSGQRRMHAHGTWVHPRFRKQGIAFELWSRAIKSTEATSIRVVCASDRGMTLVSSLRGAFPRIRFSVVDGGLRKLRDLRKNGCAA